MEPRKYDGSDFDLAEEVEDEVQTPRLFKVLLHNDDFTTRDFVIEILEEIFHKKTDEAVRIMLHVHHHGSGVAGVYTREIAETKMLQTLRLAEEHEFPLQVTIEPAEE